MPPVKKYRFETRDGWLGRLFVQLGLAQARRRIPIVGVQASGKSYFLLSLALFATRNKLGRLVGVSESYVEELLPSLLRREPLDATPSYKDFDVDVEGVYMADFETILQEEPVADDESAKFLPNVGERGPEDDRVDCNYRLATNDLPGTEFRAAMQALREPLANPEKDARVKRFVKVVEQAHGLIVVIDVVRAAMSPEDFARDRLEIVRKALAEQIVPIAKGIRLALDRASVESDVFPLFLVFTKADVHMYSRDEIASIFREVFAILLASHEGRIQLRVHCVQSVGYGGDTDAMLDARTQGIGLFLADVYHWINQPVRS